MSADATPAESEASAGESPEDDEWPAPPGRVPATASGPEERVWEALEDVLDLHVPISLVDMGMIYGVAVDGDAVTVRMTYPCMGCPGYEMLQGDVRSRVAALPGVEEVAVEVVWDPIWTKDRLTERARGKLTDCGIGI